MAISRMQEPRQLYGLGSLVKSIGKGVKKFVKSPLGKAAILGIGAFGLPGGAFGMTGFLPTNLRSLSGISSAIFSGGSTPTGGEGFLKGLIGKVPGGGLTVGAVGSILAASGMDPEEIEATKRDPEKLKIYLKDYYSKTNPNAKPEEIEAFAEMNISEYATGGRVGFADGPKLSDFIDVQAAGSKSGKQQIENAPKGFTINKETFNAIIKADIPLSKKINLLAGYEYGKGRDKIEKDDQELFLGEGGSRKREIGLGYNEGSEGLSGRIMYDPDTGKPEFRIGFKKSFQDGGRIGLKDGPKKYMFNEVLREPMSDLERASVGNPGTKEMYRSEILKMLAENRDEAKTKIPMKQKPFKPDLEKIKKLIEKKKKGLAAGGMPTGIMRTNQAGVMERDYRDEGGFVPVGIKERADDVPAMLSKNEFVMTADAVRGAGDGSIEKGAQRMYDQMKNLESKVA